MHSDSHVNVDLSRRSHITNVADHPQAQINAILRVTFVFYRYTGNAIIAVAQKLYAQYIMFLYETFIIEVRDDQFEKKNSLLTLHQT